MLDYLLHWQVRMELEHDAILRHSEPHRVCLPRGWFGRAVDSGSQLEVCPFQALWVAAYASLCRRHLEVALWLLLPVLVRGAFVCWCAFVHLSIYAFGHLLVQLCIWAFVHLCI